MPVPHTAAMQTPEVKRKRDGFGEDSSEKIAHPNKRQRQGSRDENEEEILNTPENLRISGYVEDLVESLESAWGSLLANLIARCLVYEYERDWCLVLASYLEDMQESDVYNVLSTLDESERANDDYSVSTARSIVEHALENLQL